MIEAFGRSSPWYGPALAIALLVSLLAFRRVARALRAPEPLAFLLLASLAGIVALTVTPGDDAFSPYNVVGCLLEIVRPIGIARLLTFGERGLNVLLFLPFGVCVGLLPSSPRKLAVGIGALALPFLVEGIQYALPALDRKCSAVDIIDNLSGLMIGLAAGLLIQLVVSIVTRARRARTGRTAG
jgi:glycopeptide antibiotics resistance protein